jgi:hypothetical protein
MREFFHKLRDYLRKYRRFGRRKSERMMKIKTNYPKITGFREMLESIKKGMSIARFGDGEFRVLFQHNSTKKNPYQKPSPELSRRLAEILIRRPDSKLMVCIPVFNPKHDGKGRFYKNMSFHEYYTFRHQEHLPLLVNETYGNAFFSRRHVFNELTIDEIKQIWRGRNVVFVVPKNGRFAYDDRIFGNIKSKSEINVPPVDAFAEYGRILAECLAMPKDALFFISAGMTATVLAADLADAGRQALDMGHFPNCYLEYIGEAPEPEKTPLVKSPSL